MEEILNLLKQLDYKDLIASHILTAAIGTITVYNINTKIQKYKIKKDYNKKTTILKPPKLVLNKDEVENNFDIEQLSEQIRDDLKIFITTIMNRREDFDYIAFLNNLKTLKIKSVNFDRINIIKKLLFKQDSKILGAYSSYNNLIELSKDYNKSVFFHELFHTASSVKTEQNTYIGFAQRPSSIGVGLNEGYTEYLTHKYFYEFEEVRDSCSYLLEQLIAKEIERLVGEKQMEEHYFNANLLGLITELEKYNSYKKIINFIKNLDFLCKYRVNNLVDEDMIINKLNSISNFLLECKINKELKNNLKSILYTDKAEEIYCCIKYIRHEFSLFIENEEKAKLFENTIISLEALRAIYNYKKISGKTR